VQVNLEARSHFIDEECQKWKKQVNEEKGY